MAKTVKIISDSTCDLPQSVVEEYDISVMPLHIILGDQDFEDGRGITPDEIYAWSDREKACPKTAACSVEQAMAMFEPYVNEGREVVCFSISESMSSTAQAMRLAVSQLKAEKLVHVVDSGNLSTGVGLLVMEAAEMAREGKNAAKIVKKMEELKPLVRASFVVDTLTYLHRGGRCSGVTALLGSTLRIHPRIDVIGGKMQPGKKYRGKMPKVIQNYVEEMQDELRAARKKRVFITHSGCEQEVIHMVLKYLQSMMIFSEIIISRAGGVISSHCGPGTLGVLFIAEK
ncbi:MAG: DegV family protein [Clostridiales bacterium]|nr:DegV family protein [Clostridiales bacterium]